MTIWIFEDNLDRIAVMRNCLDDRLGVRTPPVVHRTAPWFIENIESELSEIRLISLDHDIEDIDSSTFDPGTGRDVADFLATKQPVCLVIIHSTNVPTAIGMEMTLQEAGWRTRRFTPYDDTEWIGEMWIETVEELLAIVESTK